MPAEPADSTLPMPTSSPSPPSIPARATACRIACAIRVGDRMSFNAPRYARPIGVRAVEMITLAVTRSSLDVVGRALATAPPRRALLDEGARTLMKIFGSHHPLLTLL